MVIGPQKTGKDAEKKPTIRHAQTTKRLLLCAQVSGTTTSEPIHLIPPRSCGPVRGRQRRRLLPPFFHPHVIYFRCTDRELLPFFLFLSLGVLQRLKNKVVCIHYTSPELSPLIAAVWCERLGGSSRSLTR